MPRDLPVGNGSMLVNFDAAYCLRDFYFPRVGRDNNTIGHPCRTGIWVDGRFSWLHDDGWERRLRYEPDTLVTDVHLHHPGLGLSIICHDAVHHLHTIFLRSLEVRNHWNSEREIRLLFCHDFHIHEIADGDTAYYEPVNDFLVHYKWKRYFVINGRAADGSGIFQYATGTKESGPLEGTWRDAEDGELSMNPIAQGSVDSTISLRQRVPARGAVSFHYWISAERGYFEARDLDLLVRRSGPAALLDETRAYWREWVRASNPDFADLSPALADFYRRSLLIVRTQIDNGGAIIAANDGDSAAFNRDTYSYMWPRDGALVARALDMAGYHDLTRRFFTFCASLMPKPTYYPEGYLLHKYNPDGSLGSSWHPWIRDGLPALPIQEDETALVLWALWEHYNQTRDRAFVADLYPRMIRPATKFMLTYRHEPTGLPLESYDLWEERYGVLTFTTAAVCAGLRAGARFARLFRDKALEHSCAEGYERMRSAMLEHLYRPELNRFARMLDLHRDGSHSVDPCLDSSLYGIFAFGVFPADQPEVISTMQALIDRLWIKTPIGGIARYENDYYYQVSQDIERVPGNPWFICTLWVAQWWIALARSVDDLRRPREILEWVVEHALPSGVLAEQVHPYSGVPLSVSPLTWSHATFVETLLKYVNTYAVLTSSRGRRRAQPVVAEPAA
ncbi:MAG: glucan 1,3-alpha-glucosidase [Herpetosiphonaceae bacterium]|nr:MAG: glucan 1,3-alpha-glucosidase [Herpetosiphonaceae bacterium]